VLRPGDSVDLDEGGQEEWGRFGLSPVSLVLWEERFIHMLEMEVTAGDLQLTGILIPSLA